VKRHLQSPPLAALLLVLAGSGCASLQLTTIKTAQQRPSNVAVYFKVQDASGDPVSNLTAEKFRIYEDDQLVSQYESKQTIANPEVAAAHYTLLLVDMSGSVTESGSVDTLVQAVTTFTDRVEKQQKVGIYAFDGGPDLYPIVPFTDQPGSAKAGAQQLASFKGKDPSTNLNGAVVKALDELDTALGHAAQPMKFGTLVVFTDGTDRANRVPSAQMKQHVDEKPFDVFAIGLGGEILEPQLQDLGKSGTAMAADKNAIVKAFDMVGSKVEARTKSYYLLSYCSPSRAGKHQVRVEAVVGGGEKREETGSLRSDFDATGFAPGCDPSAPPSFDVTKGDALAPPPAEKDKDKDRGKKKDEKKEAKPASPKATPAKASAPRPERAEKADRGESATAQAAAPAPAPAPVPAPAPAPAPAPKANQDFTP
jgi:hypothetical protein